MTSRMTISRSSIEAHSMKTQAFFPQWMEPSLQKVVWMMSKDGSNSTMPLRPISIWWAMGSLSTKMSCFS